MDSSKEVVLLVIEHRVGHAGTGRHKLRDASLDECLGQFRVFKLVADSHTFACTDELRQVGVEGMIGEASHRGALRHARLAVVSVGERDAENLSGNHRIVGIRLVEIATTEQQQRLGVLRLEVVELLHHRGQLLLCHTDYSLTVMFVMLNAVGPSMLTSARMVGIAS